MFGHGATFHPANADLSYSEARQSALSSLRPAALGQRMGTTWLATVRPGIGWRRGWLARRLAGWPGWQPRLAGGLAWLAAGWVMVWLVGLLAA